MRHLRGEVTKLQSYKVTKLQSYKVTKSAASVVVVPAGARPRVLARLVPVEHLLREAAPVRTARLRADESLDVKVGPVTETES